MENKGTLLPKEFRSTCPIACVLDILWDKWTLLVIRDLFLNKHRYGEFSESPEMDDPDGVMKRIAFLVEYVAMHLGAEEDLMRQAGYPGLEQHAEVHRAFSQKVLSARDSFFKDQKSVTPDHVLEMMQGWFLNHILGEDKKYSPYVTPLA